MVDATTNQRTNSTTSAARCYGLKALTDVWTGDADGKPERLILTGLLGSLRWWFEVLVRGLGGSACDPSSTKCEGPKHCVVCELFGCTGWARKFRFDVLDGQGNAQRNQIKTGTTFQFRFTPFRPIRDEEWALLDLTLRLIADYGAIGGKTVYKPSDETTRGDRPHHQDYGSVEVSGWPTQVIRGQQELTNHVRNGAWHKSSHGNFAWASLENFWCINGRYLTRKSAQSSSFNRVIGRPEPKNQASNGSGWCAGGRGESKKVFSFKNPARTFGFVNPNGPARISHDDMRVRLKDLKERKEQGWADLEGDEFIVGKEVLQKLLLAGPGAAP